MTFILIVEDSDDVTPLEIALASLKDVCIKVVKNGRDAWGMIESGNPTIGAIITDINLPILDGLELISAIRSHADSARLPVIVVSGDADPAIQTRVRDLGANAYFAKPYSPAAVRNTLEGLLYAS